MHQAMGADRDAAKLARIGQYATNVRLTGIANGRSFTMVISGTSFFS